MKYDRRIKTFEQFVSETDARYFSPGEQHPNGQPQGQLQGQPGEMDIPVKVGDMKTVLDMEDPSYDMVQDEQAVLDLQSQYSLPDYAYYWEKIEDADVTEIWGGNSPGHEAPVECVYVINY